MNEWLLALDSREELIFIKCLLHGAEYWDSDDLISSSVRDWREFSRFLHGEAEAQSS